MDLFLFAGKEGETNNYGFFKEAVANGRPELLEFNKENAKLLLSCGVTEPYITAFLNDVNDVSPRTCSIDITNVLSGRLRWSSFPGRAYVLPP